MRGMGRGGRILGVSHGVSASGAVEERMARSRSGRGERGGGRTRGLRPGGARGV